jgi:hypothetical protein
MAARVAAESRQEGDSSTTFWFRRCTEHSLQDRAEHAVTVSRLPLSNGLQLVGLTALGRLPHFHACPPSLGSL